MVNQKKNHEYRPSTQKNLGVPQEMEEKQENKILYQGQEFIGTFLETPSDETEVVLFKLRSGYNKL